MRPPAAAAAAAALLLLPSLGSALVAPPTVAGRRPARLRRWAAPAAADEPVYNPEELVGASCILPDITSEDVEYEDTIATAAFERRIFNIAISSLPVVGPIVAFNSWEAVSAFVRTSLDTLSGRTWEAVDGGAYGVQLLTPTINGIVVPSISIVLGTLVAMTVQTLRMRQVEIRGALNREACEIMMLRSSVEQCYGHRGAYAEPRRQALVYLRSYTLRLISESQPGSKASRALRTAGAADSELQAFIRLIQTTPSRAPPGADLRDLYGRFDDPTCYFLQQGAWNLNNFRSGRLAQLKSGYPAIHWLILSVLGANVVFAFLVESDQEQVLFLDGIQLKILWTMLAGVGSATTALCADLAEPFRGNFCIEGEVEALHAVRASIDAVLCDDDDRRLAVAAQRRAAEGRDGGGGGAGGGEQEQEPEAQQVARDVIDAPAVKGPDW